MQHEGQPLQFLVDIGNSRVKWARIDAAGFSPLGSAERAGQKFEQFANDHWATLDAPQRMVVSNVAGPAIAKAIKGWAREHWQCGVEFVEARRQGWGVRNSYVEPNRLGADRWAALVAARQLGKGAVYIVDAGTALTIDVLAADGTHQGGLIIPGIGLMQRALLEKAPGIRLGTNGNVRGTATLLARDTAGAVQGGTLYAAVAIIDRVAQDAEAEMGVPLMRIITGGDGLKLLPLLARDFDFQEHLVLQGIGVIATKDT